jgi:hypothetical protein
LVEQWTENPRVSGSIPLGGKRNRYYYRFFLFSIPKIQ